MQDVAVCNGADATPIKARVNQVLKFKAWSASRRPRPARATSCSITGIEDIGIGETITDVEQPLPLPMLQVDEPTLT